MKRIEDLRVKDLRWLNSSAYVLELEGTEAIPDIHPGNFAEIRVDGQPEVFLRRPFSYLDCNAEGKTLKFFVKAIGKGSRKLGDLQKGQTVNLIHPLGNAFSIPENTKVLLCGGGTGVAPFIMLGRELKKKGNLVHIITGGRTAEDILFTEEFETYGDVYCTTEDGSLGERGLLTQHSLFSGETADYGMIYACGPEGMMKAVAAMARKWSVPCEVSLENLMACGFGVCLCCIQPTVHGNLCVCTEGPVFNTNDLTWQS